MTLNVHRVWWLTGVIAFLALAEAAQQERKFEDAERLLQAAKSEKDPKLRSMFVDHLGRVRSQQGVAELVTM